MKNILMISSGYCGKATANGICAQAICEELSNRKVFCEVISFGTEALRDIKQNIHYIIHKKETRGQRGLLKYISVLKRFLLHSLKPQYDEVLVDKIYEEAVGLYKNKPYDAVICMYFPLEAMVASYKLKKQFPEMKFLIYELDSVGDGLGGGKSLLERQLVFSYNVFLRKLYKQADAVFVLECHKYYWLEKYKQFKSKLEIVDLPLLKPTDDFKGERQKKIKFVYSGVLNENYRSPKKVIETFCAFDFDFQFDFYSKGCEAYLQSIENSKIIINGYVKQEELKKSLFESDFLVNIGNARSNSLPSKLINYISYCKPIIHFSMQENDICETYLKKYPEAFVVPYGKKIDEYKDALYFFVKKKKKNFSFEEVERLFEMNLPSYSVNSIIKKID